MKTKIILSSFFIVIFLLTACGQGTAAPVPVTQTPTATQPPTDIPTPTLLPTFTPFPTIDPNYLPTSSPTPLINEQVIKAWQTQIAIVTPIRTPIGQVTMRNLAVDEKDGNIYFTGINGQSVKITNSGKDRAPILSDDGKKVVFYRGQENDNVYSINADGSDERLIIQSKSLSTLGQGEIKSLTFIPKTRYLLFNTYLCNPREFLYNASDCTVSIYDVDTDTGKIGGFLSGLSGNTMQERNFEVSPNGWFISVANSGHIDIYSVSSGPLDDDMVYQSAIVYWRTKPDEYLPKQYWLPDSSGLIAIAAADKEYNEPATLPATYVVYRYKLGETATLMPLDKIIMRSSAGDDWSISPDRNWILFTHFNSYTGTDYLGNLNNGHIQVLQKTWWFLDSCIWSPDSKRFAMPNSTSFIGSTNGSSPIFIDGYFLSWIDNTRYYYTTLENNGKKLGKTYIGEIPNQ